MIGDSATIAVGDVAIAVGNPSGATGAWSTTQGIISSLNREVTVSQNGQIEELTMLQTDAPVNPGNSGGPLCNDRGEVIGIVTRKLNDYEGMGLAIPINGAMEILTAIVEKGTAEGVQSSISKTRPTIGISVLNVVEGTKFSDINGKAYTADKTGVAVVGIEKASSAYGKLQLGDIITAIDDKPIQDQDDLKQALYGYKRGDRAEITFWREGKSKTVRIVLGQSD
jgi:serine protease Do